MREDVIIKFLQGNTSLDEEKELLQWISAYPENEALYEDFRTFWLATTERVDPSAHQTEYAWQQINQKFLEKETESNKGRQMLLSAEYFRKLLRISALLLFVFLIGGTSAIIFYKNMNAPAPSGVCVISTPFGSRMHLVLPDGSIVWLNAGSTLAYQADFNGIIRHVKMQGEAFFKVKPDRKRPFVVSAGRINIKALGTSFNIKAYPDDPVVTATLVEGSIEVDGKGTGGKFSYKLKPSQNLTIPVNDVDTSVKRLSHSNVKPIVIPKKTEVKSKVNTSAVVSWKDQRWTIQGEPLNTLAVLLERRYNIKIHLITEVLGDYKFTGIIQNETIEQILKYLQYTTPLKYEVGKGEIWWDIDPELAKNYSGLIQKTKK